ncbi:MAG TPA: dihydropteroate synthase [Terriglobia bacterium]|nr:dihydropteroate synthase [Terriglobia bacterium]
MPSRSEKFIARSWPSREKFTISLAGRRVRLGERTIICGIVNVTPDSFWDGGQYLNASRAVRHALELAKAGADWIDVGGESTRPGSEPVGAEEELRRVLPVIQGIRRRAPRLPISIDTTKSEVAEQAVRAGAVIINDISGLRFDPRLAEVARRHRVPLVLMHLRGRPATMQRRPFVRSIWRSLSRGLAGSIRRAVSLGVPTSQLIIDPGLGFGKTRRQNFEIIAQLARLKRFRLPILAGASHKSFIQAMVAGEGLDIDRKANLSAYWKLTREKAGARRVASELALRAELALDFGDAAALVGLVLGGAHILRVHNVGAALPAVRIADAILAASTPRLA